MNVDLRNNVYEAKVSLLCSDCAKSERKASIIGDKLQLTLYILPEICTSLSFCDTEMSDHWERKIDFTVYYLF